MGYKFSARFITEEYKFQYVHANAESRNKRRVFDWFDKCDKMGLIPDEFQLIPEEGETKKQNNPEKKKSFHKQRKEEWRKRRTSKNVFIIKEEKKEKTEKKENVFSKARARPLL